MLLPSPITHHPFFMTTFSANFFDGKTSKAYPVQVSFDGDTFTVEGEDITHEVKAHTVGILPPLGNTRRVLMLATGERLETSDFETIATIEAKMQLNKGMTFINNIEKRWQWVLMSVAGLVIFVWAFIKFGLPFIATQAAFMTPISVAELISNQTLKIIDDQLLEPSQLPSEHQDELTKAFANITSQIGGDYPYRLEFRTGADLGANAFALPSGTIVLTDELVELSKDDLEIIGVLAHEVGHVKHRHGLRGLYQSTGIYLLVSTLLGDVTSVTSVAASLPAVLIDAGYSRDFEREADEEAGEYLLQTVDSTQALQDVLSRLSAEHGGDGLSFLASHPGTNERIEHLEMLEAR
jgi:Zn-dependent protease with chaperone function